MPEKKNSQTGNFLSWLFKKHFLKLEIIFTPTIDKEPLFLYIWDDVFHGLLCTGFAFAFSLPSGFGTFTLF